MTTKIRIIFLVFLPFLVSILTFCSAKPTIRYDEKEEKTSEKERNENTKNELKFDESFDITPFKTEIKFPNTEKPETVKDKEIWYEYDLNDNQPNKQKTVVGTTSGFRVQVIATDGLEEANKIQEELKSVKGTNEIYSVFEPPFYKILVGDFKSSDEANSLRFKLNQLGYSEARVIKSTINLFQ